MLPFDIYYGRHGAHMGFHPDGELCYIRVVPGFDGGDFYAYLQGVFGKGIVVEHEFTAGGVTIVKVMNDDSHSSVEGFQSKAWAVAERIIQKLDAATDLERPNWY